MRHHAGDHSALEHLVEGRSQRQDRKRIRVHRENHVSITRGASEYVVGLGPVTVGRESLLG